MGDGILLVALGSFCAASFYVPISGAKGIAWEVYWLMAGIFSWLVVPLIVAAATTADLFGLYSSLDSSAFLWPFIFGVLWGIGSLTYGMTLRYLGVSLGTAIANGIISAFGTLIPPIFLGTFSALISSTSGMIVFAGVIVSFAGIALTGMGGVSKERDMTSSQGGGEFNLKRGLMVALISGLMSACFNFGLTAAEPIAEMSLASGTADLYKGNAGLCVVLFGGLLVNAAYCIYMGVKNNTLSGWLKVKNIPFAKNWMLLILGGSLWYFQMMFLEMGKSRMGDVSYTAWTILMSLTIVFSTLWGFKRGEWSGVSKRTLCYLFCGLGVLILSAVVIGLAPAMV